jgi:hypothetical protein
MRGPVGGRPGVRRVLVPYLPATSLRCQASSVAGVTGKMAAQRLRGMSRASATSHTRSVGEQILATPHQPGAVAGRGEGRGGQDARGGLAQRDDGTGREPLDHRDIRGPRQHDDRAGKLGQGCDVVVVPRCSSAVDPHYGPGGLEPTHDSDDLVAGSSLVLRGDRVFKVENDRVARGGRLAEPLRAVTRAEQEGGTSRSGSRARRDGCSSDSVRSITPAPPVRRVRRPGAWRSWPRSRPAWRAGRARCRRPERPGRAPSSSPRPRQGADRR